MQLFVIFFISRTILFGYFKKKRTGTYFNSSKAPCLSQVCASSKYCHVTYFCRLVIMSALQRFVFLIHGNGCSDSSSLIFRIYSSKWNCNCYDKHIAYHQTHVSYLPSRGIIKRPNNKKHVFCLLAKYFHARVMSSVCKEY